MEPTLDNGIYTFSQQGVGSVHFRPFRTLETYGTHTYQIVLDLLPGRGDATGLALCKDAVTWIFNNTKALFIVGYIESSNLASRQFGTALGFNNVGEENGWTTWKVSVSQWSNNEGRQALDKAELRRPARWQ